MKRSILILLILLLKLATYGQKCAMPTISKDTLYFYVENLQTTDIGYFNLDSTKIKSINVIKNEDQKNIFGDPKGGKVMIYLKPNYFRGLKIGQLLKSDFYKLEGMEFYVNNCLTTKKDFMNYKVIKLDKIEFVKRDIEVYRINVTTNKNNNR